MHEDKTMLETSLSEMQEKLKSYCVFDERSVYVIMAIARKKYNPYTRSTEIALREILRKDSDIDRRVQRLYNQAKYLKDGEEKRKFYFYCSVNPRDTLKAYLNLSNELNNIFYRTMIEGTDEIHKFQKLNGL